MVRLLSLYFTSLIKRFLVLIAICSFVPLILLSFNYTWDIILPIYQDIVLMSVPLFLWINQALFCGFITPQTLFSRILLISTSTILSTTILMLAFPNVQKTFTVALDSIRPNIVAPKGSVVGTSRGVLVVNPNTLPNSLFAKPTTKALWINSNFTTFNDINTNAQSFTLTQSESLNVNGYISQKNTQIVPFYDSHSAFPQYELGHKIAQFWIDNVTTYNDNIRNFYQNMASPTDSEHLSKVLTIKEARTNSTLNRDPSAKSTPKTTKTPPDINETSNLINVFLSLLCVFSVASLLGIVSTLGQHYLGALMILALLSLYAPNFSTEVMGLSSKIELFQSSLSTTLLYLILVGILYLCTIGMLSFKSLIKGDKN